LAYAEDDAERIFQTVIIAVAFIIGTAVTLAITGPTVLDSNPTSYIIVTMIMGVLFILFTLKDPAPLKKSEYGIIGATVAFIGYLIILSYSRGLLSFEFLSYRMDALLLPLLLLSIVMAVAGFREIKRYAPVMAYLLFASPILLLTIINSNNWLSSLSAGIVYPILKASGAQVIQQGLQIISQGGQVISIASTSVPIGVFIAFIMLLVPLSYLYTGNPERKIAWLSTGVILLFVLNIIRMIIIAFVWTGLGVNAAASTLHTFGGNLIFYVSLVVIILSYRKFGLKLNLGKNWKKRLGAAFSTYDLEANFNKIVTAMIIALAALLLSIGYLSSANVSAAQFSTAPISNASYTQLFQNTFQKINATGIPYTYLGTYQGTMLFELGKNTPENSTYLVVSFYQYPEHGANVAFYASHPKTSAYVLRSGITVTSLTAVSNNATFYISYFALPIVINGTAVSANYEIFSNVAVHGLQYCDPAASSGLPEYLESSIYNVFSSGSPTHGPVLCAAEKLALG
jgi:exosortase/archaeosortase family protein